MAGTTKSIALGAELRKARQAVPGLTVRLLAQQLGISHPTVSRWERGERVPAPEDIASYLMTVDAPVEVRENLIEMSRDADSTHWLSVSIPEQRRQLRALLDLEAAATRVTTVSPLLVPGILQTGDYARAIMVEGGVAAEEIETRVAVRNGRREAITRRRNPLRLRAYIGEGVLAQSIGGADVMHDQLQALLEHGERPNVELHVIPTAASWHAGLEGPFSFYEFAGRASVVHIENRVSGLFLPDDGRAYESSLPRVQEIAMSPAESAKLIAKVSSTARRRQDDDTGQV
jgi:transcriptional regulator with XRE-family HTH domain